MTEPHFLLLHVVKKYRFFTLFAGLFFFLPLAVSGQALNHAYGKTALLESAIPVRPGIPGVLPFWNEGAHQFIYAPAFDYKEIDKAEKYRFEIVSSADGSKHTFESRVPYAALSPVWTAIPIGFFDVKVTAHASGGEEIGIAGEGKYYRAAWFNGIYHEPVMPYDASAQTALSNLLKKDYVKHWFTKKTPDPGYDYYRYPAKIMGALIVGAVTQARLKENTADAQRFTELARIVADYLISVSFKEGTPLQYCPPTYLGYEKVFKQKTPHIDTDNLMMISAADGGNAYLDLYDLTGEDKYLAAAKRIAQTYVKTQLDNGSWHMFVNAKTGREGAPNIAIPTAMINFFERLQKDHQVSGLEEATEKALNWMMENTMVTYDWQGQFEDIGARRPYSNQSREQACDMAIFLLNRSKNSAENLMLAEELIRFSEDQFVIWEKQVIKRFKKKGPKGKAWAPENWITPSVQEQYTFFQPVGRTACIMMETYRKAHEVTGKDAYLAKARSIANAFTVVQKEHDGDYPTLFSKYKSNFWLNSVVYPAKSMMDLENYIQELEGEKAQD